MKKLLLFIICLLGTFTVQAQSLRQVKGRVVLEADTARPLPYVQIVNRSRNNGAVSNLEGYFTLNVAAGDSIAFRMIGYYDTLIAYSDFQKLGYRLPMKEKVVVLKPVTIRGDNHFETFAPPERRSEDPYVGYRSVKPSGLDPVDQKIGLATTGNGAALEGAITEFANLFSKKEKQRKKVRELKERARFEEYQEALFDYWFDEKIVAELTGYKGKELKEFIKFCKPPLHFLETATEYEVILKIWHYQQQYEKLYY